MVQRIESINIDLSYWISCVRTSLGNTEAQRQLGLKVINTLPIYVLEDLHEALSDIVIQKLRRLTENLPVGCYEEIAINSLYGLLRNVIYVEIALIDRSRYIVRPQGFEGNVLRCNVSPAEYTFIQKPSLGYGG